MKAVSPLDRPEPLCRTAARIGRTVNTCYRLIRQGRLRAWQDASGRWWSTPSAAHEFLGVTPTQSVAVDIAEMKEALR